MIERHHAPRPEPFGLEAEKPVPRPDVENRFVSQIRKSQRFKFIPVNFWRPLKPLGDYPLPQVDAVPPADRLSHLLKLSLVIRSFPGRCGHD